MPDGALTPVASAASQKPLRRLFGYLWHNPKRIAVVVVLSFILAVLSFLFDLFGSRAHP